MRFRAKTRFHELSARRAFFDMCKNHQGNESGVHDFLRKTLSNFEKKECTLLRFPGDVFGTRTTGTPPHGAQLFITPPNLGYPPGGGAKAV